MIGSVCKIDFSRVSKNETLLSLKFENLNFILTKPLTITSKDSLKKLLPTNFITPLDKILEPRRDKRKIDDLTKMKT